MRKFGLLILAAILFASCADGIPVTDCVNAASDAHVYGFWGGLWHGWIVVFDAIAMIFYDDVAIYAPVNNGAWYHFGFLVGCGAFGLIVNVISAALSD